MIHVKPTIFVGLGGSGALVLQKVKYALAQRFSTDGKTVPACFKFLEVDISPKVATPLDEDCLGFDSEAGTEILIPKFGGDFAELENKILNDNAQNYQAVSGWWPDGLGAKINAVMANEEGDQAYQVRHVGRAAFWLNNLSNHGFRSRLQSAARAITDDMNLATVTSIHPEIRTSAADGINVFLVSSVAGGTGCGMLVDALANIRDVTKKTARVHTFLLLPSVYERCINEGERQAPKVNAYAALKEYDQFMRMEPGFSYSEEYSKACAIDFNKRLSSLTYLVGDIAENGRNFGGKGKRVATKTAHFITHMIMGLAEEEDQAKGVLTLVAGNVKLQKHDDCLPVAKAYSSMGLCDLVYPHNGLASYAKNYAIQFMMARITAEPAAGEDGLIKKIKSMIHGSGDTEIWQDELIPDIPDCQTKLSRATPDQFSAVKRKDLLKLVFQDYQDGKRKIDQHYKKLDNTFTATSDKAAAWILVKVKELFLDPEYGLVGSIRLLKEMRSHVEGYAKICQAEKKRENDTTLNQSAIQNLQKEYVNIQKWSTGKADREQLLTTLLAKLKGDLTARSEAYAFELAAKIAAQISEKSIKPLRTKLDALEADILGELSCARTRAQKGARELTILSAANECFGCSAKDITELEDALKEEAHKQDSALRRAIIVNFTWESLIADPIADTMVNNVHGESHFFDRLKACGISNPSEYLAAQAKRASPMCEFKGGAAANPVIFYMISRFSEEEIRRHTDGHDIPEVLSIRLSYMDPNKVTFIAVRHGMPAAHVAEVVDCFKEYKAHNGVPDSRYGITAHLMRGAADWPELVYEPKSGIDFEAYIKICRKLGLLKKDAKGNYFTIFLGEADGKDPRFNGLVNVKNALANEEGLASKVQKAIVAKLCEKFAGENTAFLAWSAANKLPEEIDKQVKKRLSLA
ncbi:MAG: hypothetical protein JJU29_01855 [Verrucomicrobia bacterium]|nr:hypothetical protein [Verrucomicrobiota bacterium]MCH8510977.1 hypothetical protein [Kiritimatiellia bacterium]